MTGKLRLGISSCLLGRPVRYDGGHKLDHFLVDTLGQFADYVAVCPEMEAGFGVPRESMHLEGDPTRPRLVTTRGNVDHTERMLAWAHRRVEELASLELDGFIFKSGSPSSGMERVSVRGAQGMPSKTGVGLFARLFMDRFPLLPVEEEGRLHDPTLRENFIDSVFTLRRWRAVLGERRAPGRLVAFHTAHKLLILSHAPEIYRAMGRLVAGAGTVPVGELFADYQRMLLRALALKVTVAKHTNVLQHMAGYFRDRLSAGERAELARVITDYRAGLLPLIVPMTLINHYVRLYREPYLGGQVYLDPHPLELRLRNHA